MGQGTNLTILFLWKRYKSMKISLLEEIKNRVTWVDKLILVNLLAMCICFVGALLGKISSSVTSIDAYRNSPHDPSQTMVTYPEIFFAFKGATITISGEFLFLWYYILH